MHSRIYVLARVNAGYEVPSIEELYESLSHINPLADYVYYSDDFDGDIEWMAQYYELKVEKKNRSYTVSREELLEKLEEEKRNNILEAKAVLCHKDLKDISDLDLYKVIRLLKNNDGFLFYFEGALLTPYDLIEMIKDKTVGDHLRIIETFDYHF